MEGNRPESPASMEYGLVTLCSLCEGIGQRIAPIRPNARKRLGLVWDPYNCKKYVSVIFRRSILFQNTLQQPAHRPDVELEGWDIQPSSQDEKHLPVAAAGVDLRCGLKYSDKLFHLWTVGRLGTAGSLPIEPACMPL